MANPFAAVDFYWLQTNQVNEKSGDVCLFILGFCVAARTATFGRDSR